MRRALAAAIAAAAILTGCGATTHHAVTRKLTPGPSACAAGYVTPYGCQAHSPTFGLPPTGPPKLTAPSSTPTVAMDDSVTVSVLRPGLPAYAGYLNGAFATYSVLVASFPSAAHVPVTVQALPIYPSTAKMVCLDVEPGDAVPAVAGAWARGERGLGVKPCEYASLRNGMEQVEQSDAAALGPHWRAMVFLWDADWTGTPRLDAGFDATQWLNHGPGGQNYDQNVVTRSFLGLTSPRPPLDLGGAQHYERYPQAPRRPDRERASVQGWDSHACMNPVRRPVCRVTRSHLAFDLGRDQTLYQRDTRRQRDQLHLPGRIQGLSHRLNNGRGIVRRWL